jgi:hypothetical protein
MADMALIQAAVLGLKAAADIAIGFNKLKTMAEVQGKAIELQQIILSAQSNALSAQSEQFRLIERIRELEKEVVDVKAWEETAKCYRLVSPWTSAFVYALTKASGSSEPPHWLCEKCYQDGHKSILQRIAAPRVTWIYDCARCKTKLHLHGGWDISTDYAEDTKTQNVN